LFFCDKIFKIYIVMEPLCKIVAAFVLVIILRTAAFPMDKKITTIYVATDGNDGWSGLYPDANSDKNDGPLATIEGARDKIRKIRSSGSFPDRINVLIRGGRYQISKPIVFTPGDSGPITYASFPGEKPILDCGEKITGWKKTTVNGTDAYVSEIPEVKDDKWYFRQLFVNGKRKKRTSLPEKGFFRIKDVPEMKQKAGLFDGSYSFYCHRDDINQWKNLSDVEVIIFHKWIEERMPVKQFDGKTGLVVSSRKSIMALNKEERYKVENVFEALRNPGEWYLDRQHGLVYYIPEKDETIETAEIYAPRITQAIRLEGNPEENQFVEHLTFKGITIEHTDWVQPDDGKASCAQAAHTIPGVVFMKGSRHCIIQECEIRHCGWYGIEISNGCTDINVNSNNIWDMGAGGIKINGSDAGSPLYNRTCSIVVSDNHIHDCGNVFYSAAGILSMHASDNEFSRNHIHDLYYSGISCGWVWGYSESVSKNNVIENNIIHDIGKSILSDMGGIYTLGVQPGTVIRGNIIYRINMAEYGAWCIYLDEGSSHIIVENNLCAYTNSQVFHQHYGRENIIRNNIFAFGDEGIVSFSRNEKHNSFTFERNILLAEGKPFFVFGYGIDSVCGFSSDLNMFWDISDKDECWGFVNKHNKKISLKQAQQQGYDTHSVCADPGFVDPENFDFRLRSNKSVKPIGFKPFITRSFLEKKHGQ